MLRWLFQRMDDAHSAKFIQSDYHRQRKGSFLITVSAGCSMSCKLLREPDEQPVGRAEIAEPVRIFILHHLANQPGPVFFCKPRDQFIDVLDREHGAQVAQRIYRGAAMLGNDGRSEKL